MTTATEVYRDSYGKQLTTEAHAAREKKIQELMKGGRDRFAAENLADGRPEWSQRVDCTGTDYTKSEAYQANARQNAENAKNSRRRDPLLQEKFDGIQWQLREWQSVLDDAEVHTLRLEKAKHTALEILDEIKGFTDAAARNDEQTARQKLAAIEPRLAAKQKRIDNAKVQLKTWRERLKEFPQEELKQLRREEARREALRF